MPWDVLKRGDKYVVVKETNGEVVGTHESRQKAVAQLRALYASETAPKDSPGTMMHGGVMALNSSYEPEVITHAYVNGRKVPVTHTPPPSEAAAPSAAPDAAPLEERDRDFKSLVKPMTK